MPIAGAAAWITTNCPIPADMPGSRKHCCTGNVGCDLLQQFQPLSTQVIFELHEACDVAARLRQTIDKSRADRIRRYRKYDRDVALRP